MRTAAFKTKIVAKQSDIFAAQRIHKAAKVSAVV
jgi:hypothetical protein